MRTLMHEDFMNIIYGSSFFGGGGGGAMEEGINLLDTLKVEEQKLDMYDIDELKDDTDIVSTMVAALGSPIATKGKLFEEEAINAVKGMGEEAKALGKTLKYVYSGEQGGGNTMLPLYAAIKLGLDTLNTDGNGRAVPELNTGLQPIYGIPTSPVVLASDKGDTIVGRTNDPCDSKACEGIARQMCQAYDMGIGFCAWMMTKKDHLNSSAVGQMTKTEEVGRILRGFAPEEALLRLRDALREEHFTELVRKGTITKIIADTSGGFDTGTIVVTGEYGDEFKILYQNENLVAYGKGGNAIATVPDIISILEYDKETDRLIARSNSEIEVGQTVALTKTLAHKRWYENEKGYDCWREVLISAGYCTVNPQVR